MAQKESDILILGRLWSSSTDGKLVDVEQVDGLEEKLKNVQTDLNIENGKGTDSLVQSYSGKVDSKHFGNTNTGESAVVFGEANSNTENRTLVSGKMNDSQAGNSIISGLGNGRGIGETATLDEIQGNNLILTGFNNQNKKTSSIDGIADNNAISGEQNINTDSNSSIIGGYQNRNTNGHRSLIAGRDNTNTAYYSIVAGYNNTNNATEGTVFGYNNTNNGQRAIVTGDTNTNSGGRSAISGGSNQNTAYDVVIGGYGNNNTARGGALFGVGNTNWSENALIAGKYNNPKSNNFLFQLGNGTGSNSRSNAFEVTKDGIARAYGTPKSDNDLIRKIDISNLEKLVSGLTDAQILALNNFAKSLTVEE
jgi:hypothetical protein